MSGGLGLTMRCRKETYHDSHACALDDGAEDEHARCDLPASGSSLHAASYDDDERDEGAELDDDGEGDQEANRPPHIAEGWILEAVCLARERHASVIEGRAAAMKTVGYLTLTILRVVSMDSRKCSR